MKNKGLNRLWLLPVVLLAFASCSSSGVDDADISLDKTTVSANKRGLTYEGGDVTFEVTSNVYWIINMDEEAEQWLSLSPRAASGNQIVKVTAQPNAGAARSAVLHFDSLDGVTAEIEVRQGSYDELIFYVRTGMGTTPVSEEVALSDFSQWQADGIGASGVSFSGVNAFVSAADVSSGYDAASGGNNVHLAMPETPGGPVSTFAVNNVETKDDRYFRLKFGVRALSGTLTPTDLQVLIGNGGDEYVDLEYEVLEGAGDWKEVLSRFQIGEDNPILDFRIATATGEYLIDDFRLYEGNTGEGEEVVFKVGADDGKEAGYVYFEDDFNWVTDVYGGTDYIGGWPSAPSAETYWNGITAATVGEEAYNTLVNSGWTTDDNKLKERVYMRIGYIKMGRGSNAAGCGGGLVTPALGIKKNCTSKLKVSFDCCIFVANNGTWDPSTMQVRIIGPGTINDGSATVREFLMQTVTPVQWETKELLVLGATNATQIVFESVAETTANRWFFDNVRVVKADDSDLPPVELTPLPTPEVSFDEGAATEASVKFTWKSVSGAASYEYSYTCLHCGEVVESRSGKTQELAIEFTELIAGTSAELKVRALPADGDKLYKESEWSAAATGAVKDPSEQKTDSHAEGHAFVDDDLSWITAALCGHVSFVDEFPANPGGVRFDSAPAAMKTLLAEKGWAMTAANSAAYLYAGSIKLATASAVGSVFTPAVSGIDAGAKVNAEVIVGGTAFLGTNSVYDDDAVAISIVGEGTFDDGSTTRRFRLRTWNDWYRQRFVVLGINNATKFKLETLTAAKGRVFFNYFGVVKLADSYDPAAQLPVLAAPSDVTVSSSSAYGFDASWTAVPNATDYTYYVVLPDGKTVATGKTWEPRVHIGGMAGKNLSAKYSYFNFRVEANHMNYNSSKVEVPQTFCSSSSSVAVQAPIAASTATVYFEDDFSWADPASGSTELATMTDWINTYCTTDKMIRLDVLEKEGVVSLNGWGYDNTNKSVYTRPGYIHINSSAALGNLVSPALSAIAGTDDVLVSFDATYFYQYFSKAADAGSFTARLEGAGTIEGATGGVIEFTLSRGDAWEGFSFTVTGADATTKVVFAPAAASKNRVQFDNFRVESLTR
ncbi:BACON domain-containing protein [uncultured Alistipes sp.]|uniref:BACON domain-containing protein n=1 Tax=uncultured Alistipes sp. TaxID=538949 RepID=UPI0025E5711D|nr:BACON domain-containing protein [uncultured Alistipes sp.]